MEAFLPIFPGAFCLDPSYPNQYSEMPLFPYVKKEKGFQPGLPRASLGAHSAPCPMHTPPRQPLFLQTSSMQLSLSLHTGDGSSSVHS